MRYPFLIIKGLSLEVKLNLKAYNFKLRAHSYTHAHINTHL